MKNILNIFYFLSVCIFMITGLIINVYYEHTILQYLIIPSLLIFLATEILIRKNKRLMYYIFNLISIFIISIPLSMEFFVPIIEINSYRSLERILLSPILAYPVLIIIIVFYWKRLFYDYKKNKNHL